MVGKAWRLATTRRRRAAWAAEAVSVVRLAAVIAPATGGARWLTSPMMVLRQALIESLLQQASALRSLPFSNALDPRRSKQTGACGRSVRSAGAWWIPVAHFRSPTAAPGTGLEM